mmetsp:Transcript_21941/g.68272  ORF Transcript_21941/g.68272 Transcript_21941/m.68272 type:complete len:294 (+) Transcript_21941:428-1309(+)
MADPSPDPHGPPSRRGRPQRRPPPRPPQVPCRCRPRRASARGPGELPPLHSVSSNNKRTRQPLPPPPGQQHRRRPLRATRPPPRAPGSPPPRLRLPRAPHPRRVSPPSRNITSTTASPTSCASRIEMLLRACASRRRLRDCSKRTCTPCPPPSARQEFPPIACACPTSTYPTACARRRGLHSAHLPLRFRRTPHVLARENRASRGSRAELHHRSRGARAAGTRVASSRPLPCSASWPPTLEAGCPSGWRHGWLLAPRLLSRSSTASAGCSRRARPDAWPHRGPWRASRASQRQ